MLTLSTSNLTQAGLGDVPGREAGTMVDVFREDGVYQGRMTIPGRALLRGRDRRGVVHATPEYVLMATVDDLDVHYVSRFRIRRDG